MDRLFTSLIFALSGITVARSAATPSTSSQSTTSALPLIRDVAVPRFFGTALNTTFLYNDANYTRLAETQYSIFTPENEMKWENIEPEPNLFNYTAPDEIVSFAERVNAKVRGHNFMWENQLPPWINTSLTATELDNALKNHIDKIMTHYRGKLYAFDVINEMISDNTPNETFKDTIWTEKFGEEAVPKALEYAKAAAQAGNDPIKLYMNDYGTEGINSKSDTLYEVVKGFLADGVPIDALGFQCHFDVGQVPTTLQENLQRFADLGLDVAITELDINLNGPGNATLLEQQAKDFYTVVSACVAVSRCVSVTTWGISDDHSWIANGNPLPFNAEKQPKPAFYGIIDAFTHKPEP